MADVFIVNDGGVVHSVTEEHCEEHCKTQTAHGRQFKPGFRLATKQEIAAYLGKPVEPESKPEKGDGKSGDGK